MSADHKNYRWKIIGCAIAAFCIGVLVGVLVMPTRIGYEVVVDRTVCNPEFVKTHFIGSRLLHMGSESVTSHSGALVVLKRRF